MSKLYDGGAAPLSQTFGFTEAAPIDDRVAVQTKSDLSNLNAYKGLMVYVEDEDNYYTYTCINKNTYKWKPLKTISVSTVNDLSSLDAYPGLMVYVRSEEDYYTYTTVNKGSTYAWRPLKTEKTVIAGDVSGTVYETLFALQAEVARLRNSFLYGITSYQGSDTAASRVVDGMKEIDDKEPLWAIDENDLSIFEELLVDLNTKASIKPLDGTTLDVTVQDILGIDKGVWEDDANILKEDSSSKHIIYLASTNDDIQLEYFYKDSEDTNILSLKGLTNGLSAESYHYMIIISRSVKSKGYNYIYISIDNNINGQNLIHGYYNNGQLERNPVYLQKDCYLHKIYFNNLQLSKLNFYSKPQDFSNEVIPSAPKEQDYKYSAAHITIREVANDEKLEKIKHQLLMPELVWIRDTQELKINTSDGIFVIGSSKTTKPTIKEDMATRDGLIELGIIKETENEDLFELDNISGITFITENNDKYDIGIDSEGKLKTTKHASGTEVTLASLVQQAKTWPIGPFTFEHSTVRGFAAKILYAKNKATDALTKDWIFNADRIKIGNLYFKGRCDIPHCSHAYIELENTSNDDFPLDGCKLSYVIGKPSVVKTIELSGVIKSNSTYLIRGKKYIDYDKAIISVSTYDLEWLALDTTDELSDSADIQFILYYDDKSAATPINLQQTAFVTVNTAADAQEVIKADSIDLTKYPWRYDYRYIDSLAIKRNNSGDYKAWCGKAYTTILNDAIYKNTFELDPAKQAFQGLSGTDSSRVRNNKLDNDGMIIPLNRGEYITFNKSFEAYPISNFTPKASFENKNVCTDKTKFDKIKPNMVTCSFGQDMYTTRCFNWVSYGNANEFVFIKTSNGWERFESYGGYNNDNSINWTKKALSGTAEPIIYNRMTGVFPGEGSKYTGHKCIISLANAPTSKTIYTYVVGRAGQDGNPDPIHSSEEYTFTMYPNTFIPKVYQITDQQGFHWIEYQAWAAAALEINKKIEYDISNSDIIPVLINTGDMTQNGTRINEWLDYYNAGKCLFRHLEQMNVVGNNDLCNDDHEILGTGNDNGKINPYYFHLFYCYEQPDPANFIINNRYIPSTYWFGAGKYKFLMLNSEITKVACENMYGLAHKTGDKTVYTTNIYTGYNILDAAKIEKNGDKWNISEIYNGGITPIYNVLYKWLDTYKTVDNTNVWLAACHEMPFTVVTQANLAIVETTLKTHRSIDTTGSLVGAHMNQLTQYDTFGLYWFSRLLEYFNIPLCIGGHKHTYVCTFPLRENFSWNDNGTIKNSKDNQYIMPSTLNTEMEQGIDWFAAENGYSSTKYPYSSVASHESGGTTYAYPLASEKTSQNCVTYIMSQATGYKVKSNKELPSYTQAYSMVVAGNGKTSATENQSKSDAAQASQLNPMFGIVKFTNKTIKAALIRINNIKNVNGNTDTFGEYTANGKNEPVQSAELQYLHFEERPTATQVIDSNIEEGVNGSIVTKDGKISPWQTAKNYNEELYIFNYGEE